MRLALRAEISAPADAAVHLPFAGQIFVDKGFRVLPTSFRNVDAVNRFIDQSLAVPSDKVLGHLCTVWHPLAQGKYGKLKQLKAASKKINAARAGR